MQLLSQQGTEIQKIIKTLNEEKQEAVEKTVAYYK